MKYEHIHLIGCGVLRIDMDAVSKELGVPFSCTWLEGGLHSRPAELRMRLQEAIDAVDDADIIALGYGLCGRGTVDIRARSIPLVIPRVHDCISLFLGSDEAYRSEFARCPGTYYISAGWYEEKIQPKQGPSHVERRTEDRIENPSFHYLVEKYGRDNAEEITSFLSSWQKNYQRSVFIDTGSEQKKVYEDYAKAMAEEFDWKFQRLDGSLELLKALLDPDGDERLLFVPPGYITAFDPRSRKLTALPEAGAQDTAAPEKAAKQAPPSERGKGLGLGIDAGGTYTDVAVFDFEGRKVLDTAKALTTKWDYTVGINQALDGMKQGWFERIDLVAVSTTLATNAIVEGTGQPVGLILMSPSSMADGEYSVPTAVVSGRMDISGNELEPIDENEVVRVARAMIDRHQIKAFAVSGYGGSVNPIQEMQVRDLLKRHTDLDVCCGHELSDLLDFKVRAHTAVLNAGIIPLLERFLEDCGTSLKSRGIHAPLMVVKGDGSLMKDSRARLHPVETILSGPAASIAGAKYLTRLDNATIVDVGGTTSDIGRLDDGVVEVCTRGAVVGKWRTHVRAVDMHTLGLGGDSEIFVEKQVLHVGPRRVAPICWLATNWDCSEAFAHLRRQPDYYASDTRLTELYIATGRNPQMDLTEQERQILELISSTPMTAIQLVEHLGVGHPALLQMKRLESDYLVQRCGLTPTDLLHAAGTISLWDKEAPILFQSIIAEITQKAPDVFRDEVFSLISERLVFELVKRQLPLDYSGEDLEDSDTGKALFDTLLKADNPHVNISAELQDPVIGLGAAASLFLAEPASRLSAQLIVPEHAAVANAVGAVTSLVRVSRKGSISPSPDGLYLLSGVKGNHSYKDFDEAHEALVELLHSEVLVLAREAGTDEKRVDVEFVDNIGMAADGTKIFIERNITAGVTGIPVGD